MHQDYDINRPWLTLDDWQDDYIQDNQKHCFLLCGRQSGKSAAMSIKIGECAVREKDPGEYLVIAFTEKQAYALFFKVLMYLEAVYPKMIMRGKDKPTMHEINLKNGITINCHAAGLSGDSLRHYTLKRLFIDEAAPMSKEVFIAVTPMLSVTGGFMDIASTPRGKEGFFYDCSLREDFRKFYVSAEDCPRHDKKFLESEKKTMSALRYAQEYLAVFLDELKRFFDDELIKKCCLLKRPDGVAYSDTRKYLGVDLARMGEDESVFTIVEKIRDSKFRQVENIITRKTFTTESVKRIIDLERVYKFKSIGIDAGSGSLGVGIYDFLKTQDETRKKVVDINNRKVRHDKEGKMTGRLFKEDLYDNLKGMMERGEIKLLDDDELILSLKSVQYEFVIAANSLTKARIFGNYTHCVEALIRAAWEASKDKHLNLWVRYT